MNIFKQIKDKTDNSFENSQLGNVNISIIHKSKNSMYDKMDNRSDESIKADDDPSFYEEIKIALKQSKVRDN